MAAASLVVAVGSTNPVKVEATRAAFARMFPDRLAPTVVGVDAPSGVPPQPFGNDETRRGAVNRAAAAATMVASADFSVGLEGGCEWESGGWRPRADSAGPSDVPPDDLLCFAYMAVRAAPRPGPVPHPARWSSARTAALVLPRAVAELVRGGMELGHADDAVFGRSNSKHANGAVGLLTRDAVTRAGYYEHALMLALAPFVNEAHYFGVGQGQGGEEEAQPQALQS